GAVEEQHPAAALDVPAGAGRGAEAAVAQRERDAGSQVDLGADGAVAADGAAAAGPALADDPLRQGELARRRRALRGRAGRHRRRWTGAVHCRRGQRLGPSSRPREPLPANDTHTEESHGQTAQPDCLPVHAALAFPRRPSIARDSRAGASRDHSLIRRPKRSVLTRMPDVSVATNLPAAPASYGDWGKRLIV